MLAIVSAGECISRAGLVQLPHQLLLLFVHHRESQRHAASKVNDVAVRKLGLPDAFPRPTRTLAGHECSVLRGQVFYPGASTTLENAGVKSADAGVSDAQPIGGMAPVDQGHST